MVARAAVLALMTLGAVQSVPSTRVIVEAVTRYVVQYQHDFTHLVADEDSVQRVVVRGAVSRTRQTTGEFYAVFADQARTWISVHDVAEVDGVPVPDRDDLRSMLIREPIVGLAQRIATANARFNIGAVSRNFNEPTLALLLFVPPRVRDVAFDRGSVERTPAADTLVTLGLRGRDELTFVRGVNGRVSVRGTAVVEPVSGRVRRTTLTIDDGQIEARLETTYAFEPHVGLWVPVTFDEQYADKIETTLVHTTLSNYRRFETSGRLVQ